MENEEPVKKKLRTDIDVDFNKTIGNGILDKENTEKVEVIVIEDDNETTNEGKTENVSNSKEAEQKVGMELSLNKIHFQGIVKQRYSDFIVRECDLDSNLVFLSDTSHLDQNPDENKSVPAIPPCPIEDNEMLEKLEKFANSEEEEDSKNTMEIKISDDKEHRRLVHVYIKAKYANIETGTKMLEDKSRVIVLSYRNKNKSNRRDRKKIPKYCHFTLFKQNKDTMECINLIAKMLKIHPGNFAYAGTKDRRATTIQRVSVQSTFSKRLHDLNKRLRNIVLGNFKYAETGLRLGDLSGNEFTLVIRDISKCSDEDVNKACTSLKENGCINYFGLQRFGTGTVPTHEIGKSLLKSNFEEAFNMVLRLPEDSDNVQSKEKEALKIWADTKDAEKAYKAVRIKRSNEGKLLEGLKKLGGKNFWDAMKTLPRNMRLLYLHSYQSLIWNKTVSYRIKKFGTVPVKGDLVLADKDEKGFQKAKLIDEEEISAKKYTIEDVVVPLPGYDVIYPSNSCYDYMKTIMADDGLDITDMRRPQKELSLSGAYRSIIIKPKTMNWEMIRYNDFTIPLVQTDVDKMQKNDYTNENVDIADGKFLALKLQMNLPSSCYATTALRELLTSDSSFQSQVKLNEKFLSKTSHEK